MAEVFHGFSDLFVDVLFGDPFLFRAKHTTGYKIASQPFCATETAASGQRCGSLGCTGGGSPVYGTGYALSASGYNGQSATESLFRGKSLQPTSTSVPRLVCSAIVFLAGCASKAIVPHGRF
jgi:hypothetical protein